MADKVFSMTMDPRHADTYAPALAVAGTPGNVVITNFRSALETIHTQAAAIEAATTEFARGQPVAGTRQMEIWKQQGNRTEFRDGQERPVLEPAVARPFQEALDDSLRCAGGAHDKAVTQIKEQISELESRVAKATLNPEKEKNSEAHLATEIRAHVKSIGNDATRFLFVSRLIDAKDRSAVAAILHSPVYLTGLNPDAHAKLLAYAQQAFAGEAVVQLEASRQALAHLSKASDEFIALYAKSRPSTPDTSKQNAIAALAAVAKGAAA